MFVNNVVQNPGGGIAYGWCPRSGRGASGSRARWPSGQRRPQSARFPQSALRASRAGTKVTAYLSDNLFFDAADRPLPTECAVQGGLNKPTGPDDSVHALNVRSPLPRTGSRKPARATGIYVLTG